MLGVLIKQELHTGTGAKQKYLNLISSTHTFQIPLLLHSESSVQVGSPSPEVIIQKAVCACTYLWCFFRVRLLRWCAVAGKWQPGNLFFSKYMQKTFPPALTRSLWQANNTCYIFFKKQVMCFKAVKNCCLYHTSCLSPG